MDKDVVRYLESRTKWKNGCLEFTNKLSYSGYACISIDTNIGRKYNATRLHRIVWESVNGPIPSGMVVMHVCDNRGCVNIEHLQVGTQAENLVDMRSKGRGSKPPINWGNRCRLGKV